VHMVTRTFGAGVGAERDNAVTVNVGPIFNDPKIYERYITFLNLGAKSQDDYSRPIATPKPSAPTRPPQPKSVMTNEWTDSHNNLTSKEVVTIAEFQSPPPPESSTSIKFAGPSPPGFVTALMSSPTKPGTGYLPHTVRKWGDAWYYVPLQFKGEFSDLCLSLVAREPKMSAGTSGGAQDETVKALNQLNNQLMQQNSLPQSR